MEQTWTIGEVESCASARRILMLVLRWCPDPIPPTYLCRQPRASECPVLVTASRDDFNLTRQVPKINSNNFCVPRTAHLSIKIFYKNNLHRNSKNTVISNVHFWGEHCLSMTHSTLFLQLFGKNVDQMPFMSCNQKCQSTKGKCYYHGFPFNWHIIMITTKNSGFIRLIGV